MNVSLEYGIVKNMSIATQNQTHEIEDYLNGYLTVSANELYNHSFSHKLYPAQSHNP